MTYARKVDRSQDAIVGALRECGAVVISMTGDPRIGYDITVVFRGVVYLAELKNPDDPPSAQQLTRREQQRKWEVERAGGVYHVWTTPWDALREIGAIDGTPMEAMGR